MDMQLVLACLGIMGKGMLGIFTVILVIWALTIRRIPCLTYHIRRRISYIYTKKIIISIY